MKKLTIIPGDGIGPEVMNSVIEVLKAVGAPFEYEYADAGEKALKDHGDLLPESTLASIERNRLAIKGPTGTPTGGGHKSLNVRLRQHFELYANVRPVVNLPGVPSLHANVNLIIVRENTEDLYTGNERMIDEGKPTEAAEGIKRISRQASERIAKAAYKVAGQSGKKKVAVVHKANIMKMTDGLFLRACQDAAKAFPQIELRDVIIDNCCMQLVTKPGQFEVLVTENLYGDILSDLCAGLVGGLGVVPGANIGDDCAIFEAVHGSAPDIAGKGLANPTALLLSAVMMLEYCGEAGRAGQIRKALNAALGDKSVCTGDIGGKGNTATFTEAVVKGLK